MSEPVTFLKQLISAAGLSGYEAPVRELLEVAWRPLVDELRVSRLGSLHALRRGIGAEPRPALLYAAHMDAIGMMVSGLLDGFLRVSEVGGLDPRILSGQLVIVHGRRDLPGVIVPLPENLLPAEKGETFGKLGRLLVDVGLTAADVQQLVRVGDLVSFAQLPIELSEDYLAGHSLDNRASLAALTGCLQVLQGRQTAWDVWFVATTQEEVSFGGGADLGIRAASGAGGCHRCHIRQRAGQPRLTAPLPRAKVPRWAGVRISTPVCIAGSKSWPSVWRFPIKLS